MNDFERLKADLNEYDARQNARRLQKAFSDLSHMARQARQRPLMKSTRPGRATRPATGNQARKILDRARQALDSEIGTMPASEIALRGLILNRLETKLKARGMS